jgi:hypothetical protein
LRRAASLRLQKRCTTRDEGHCGDCDAKSIHFLPFLRADCGQNRVLRRPCYRLVTDYR